MSVQIIGNYFNIINFACNLYSTQITLGKEMDQNYQEEEVKAEPQHNQEQIQLNRLIFTILGEASKSNPVFPAQLAKKTCEEYGLESSDNVFYSLMSNVVQYSLNDILSNTKETRVGGKYKKQAKDLTLKTVDVQKVFQSKDIFIAKPRMYPEISVVDQSTSQQKMDTQ